MKAHLKKAKVISLSACTIAKNEEKNIGKSIRSYRKYADEIIVVDTGSTDRTVEIAESLGARVIHFPWCDDFAAAKNAALDQAAGNWILFLDADESLAGKTAENLCAVAFAAQQKGYNAVGCRMENLDPETNERAADGYSVRLFRKGIRYRYPIHEEIYADGGIHVFNVDKSYYYLIHTGYAASKARGKCLRNLPLLLKDVEETDSQVRKTTDLFYISDAYIGLAEWEKARRYAERFLEESAANNVQLLGLRTKPYLNILNALEHEKAEPEKLEHWLGILEEKFPDNPDGAFVRGRLEFSRYRFAEARDALLRAIGLSESYLGVSVDSVAGKKASIYNLCGACEETLFHIPEAVDFFFKGAQQETESQPPLFSLFRLVKDMPEQAVTEFADTLYKSAPSAKKVTVLAALMGNYMSSQLLRCYAALRSRQEDGPLRADVTAFLLVGKGDYAGAARMFMMQHDNGGYARRALACALLAPGGEGEALWAEAAEAAGSSCAFAAGLAEKPDAPDTGAMVDFYIELSRMGHGDVAERLSLRAAESLTPEENLVFARGFGEQSGCPLALAAVEHTALSPETVFLQGFYCYRLGRFYEAEDLLTLARRAGCKNAQGAAELAARARELQKPGEEAALRTLHEQAEAAAAAGDFARASQAFAAYRRAALPDAPLCSIEAAVRYYAGEYRRAALAAESGLLRSPGDFDLLYNAACAYEKLGDSERAAARYEKALALCRDDALRKEITQELRRSGRRTGT